MEETQLADERLKAAVKEFCALIDGHLELMKGFKDVLQAVGDVLAAKASELQAKEVLDQYLNAKAFRPSPKRARFDALPWDDEDEKTSPS